MVNPVPMDVDIPNNLETLRAVANHVFLPPKLPHAAEPPEETKAYELLLCDTVIDCARQYRNLLPSGQQTAWIHIIGMLEHLRKTVDVALTLKKLAADLSKMAAGGTSTPKPLWLLSLKSHLGCR